MPVAKARTKNPKTRVGATWRVTSYDAAHRRVETESKGGTVLDEVVIDQWFHLEQMDTRHWWLGIGDVHIHIWIGRDGRPAVSVEEP